MFFWINEAMQAKYWKAFAYHYCNKNLFLQSNMLLHGTEVKIHSFYTTVTFKDTLDAKK